MPTLPRAGPGAPRRRAARSSRWIGTAVTVLLFAGFTVFLVLRLQEGFERRATEWFESADEVPEERDEVVSEEPEFTWFDEQGRPLLQGRAEQALGRSDGQQRFLEVELRLIGVYAGEDAVVTADELLLDPQTLAVEFIGNALLSVEGLELSGPHLHFRRAPDRLWSRDPVQFRSEDFVGIAASMQFDIEAGDVSLHGVVAGPVEEDGFSVVAERVRFDRETADTTLFGEVEISSDQIELFSKESVIARRDRERNQMRSIEAGFGTELTLVGATGEEGAAPLEETNREAARLRGDALEIRLEDGRIPRLVRVTENPSFSGSSGAELRGDEGSFALDPEGTPERLSMTGAVTSRLPAGDERRQLISVDSSQLEVTFDPQGNIAMAVFGEGVRARYGRASATAEGAHWNGSDTLVLEGNPRVVDSSLLELEGRDLRLVIAEPSRVEAAGAVTARFLPARLDWLPGRFEGVVLTGNSAVIETGRGQGVFTGGVRLLFGKNRLLADEVKVDADGRALEAMGGVATSLELDMPVPNPTEPDETASGLSGAPGGAGGGTPVAEGGVPPAGEASPASPFVFTAQAERFRYAAEEGQLSYGGAPSLEHRGPAGEVSRLLAGRIEADLTTDGSLGAVRGIQGARFERGRNLVRGSRIRYEPGADLLVAWGSPAVVEVDGRSSEGGLVELALADNRTEIHPTRIRRAVTRSRIANRGAEARR